MKRIIFLSAVVILLFIIVNLSFSLVTLWSKKDLLIRAQKELEKQKQEQATLQQQLKKVNDPSFVEEEARNKLFLGKPGDVLVIVPTASPSAIDSTIPDTRPIWQQWWDIFF